ncbi:hypothetical protein KIN20_005712 [Parelaphostrongylus tenuis]|uniref:Uncharacterized protein n=1 Tax=Parelaphostrongylus tenuis TaxID=148309 RepID=A0AAD5MJ52_PARTN|nr:hypothetical protein KIN20_005712 [Parelaphostrongylus tenuis]
MEVVKPRVDGFTLPVNMAWSSQATAAAKAPGLLGSAAAVESFVQRLTMQAVIDVLEEQGRRAGLLPVVVSAILNQLTVRTNYSALQCPDIVVNPSAANMPMGLCLIPFLFRLHKKFAYEGFNDQH